jgi:pilus assembly protein Flp/PilA
MVMARGQSFDQFNDSDDTSSTHVPPQAGHVADERTTHFGGSGAMNSIGQFFRDEDGQDVVEYGLLIATIAIVVLVGISFFGNNITAWFEILAKRITTTGT